MLKPEISKELERIAVGSWYFKKDVDGNYKTFYSLEFRFNAKGFKCTATLMGESLDELEAKFFEFLSK